MTVSSRLCARTILAVICLLLLAVPAQASSGGVEALTPELPLSVQGTDVMVLKQTGVTVMGDHDVKGNATVAGTADVTGAIYGGGFIYKKGATQVQVFPPINPAACTVGSLLRWKGDGAVECVTVPTCASNYALTYDGTTFSCVSYK